MSHSNLIKRHTAKSNPVSRHLDHRGINVSSYNSDDSDGDNNNNNNNSSSNGDNNWYNNSERIKGNSNKNRNPVYSRIKSSISVMKGFWSDSTDDARRPPAVSTTTTTTSTSTTSRQDGQQQSLHQRQRQQSQQSQQSQQAPKDPNDKPMPTEEDQNDYYNYALLIALYTLQGIPMGLSASIPFLIQQKIKVLSTAAAAATAGAATAGGAASAASAAGATAASASYNANAIFALCSWPFSLKLLWAPIVDACFCKRFGRRKTWLVPVQTLAGIIMILGADFVQQQLGLGEEITAINPTGGIDINENTKTARRVLSETAAAATTTASAAASSTMNVRGVTAFFFVLYFLMATQDIAVDGWALTMLSKKNRGNGPVCNSIGQNIGYFISFVGFLALNDAEASENLWRPLFGLPSNPNVGLVSLGGFVRFMGYFMLATTTVVAFAKRENAPVTTTSTTMTTTNKTQETTTTTTFINNNYYNNDVDSFSNLNSSNNTASTAGTPGAPMCDVVDPASLLRKKFDDIDDDDDQELDASEIGLKETYHRLWAVCQLPSVRWLFIILLTYRLPTALSDNVKFLKAVEYGLSKSITALLSPTLILPLGILVPIMAARIWQGHPLRQFMTAYKIRVMLVPLLDVLMLHIIHQHHIYGAQAGGGKLVFWITVVASTAMQAIVNSLQFNAQMTFFARRVDPAIGGSYMTLLNTAANLGSTWPSSIVMWMLGIVSKGTDPDCLLRQQQQRKLQKELTLQREQQRSRSRISFGAVGGARGGSGDSTGSMEEIICTGVGLRGDPYFVFQLVLSTLGCLWIVFLGKHVTRLANLPDDAWRTHLLDSDDETSIDLEVSDNTTVTKDAKHE